MTAYPQMSYTINTRFGNFTWKGGNHNSCKKFHFPQQILSRLLRWNYIYKTKFTYILKPAVSEALRKKVSILNFMLNTNLKTTENKKVEVFVHFSTIMKSDSNAGSVTAAVPCSWWSSCGAHWLQPSFREEKLDLPTTTNNMLAIFSFFSFFLFFFSLLKLILNLIFIGQPECISVS